MDELSRFLYRKFAEQPSRRGFVGMVAKAMAACVAMAAGVKLAEPGGAGAQTGARLQSSGFGHTGGVARNPTPVPTQNPLKCCSGIPCPSHVCPAGDTVNYTWYCCDPSSQYKVICSDCYATQNGKLKYRCTHSEVTAISGCA